MFRKFFNKITKRSSLNAEELLTVEKYRTQRDNVFTDNNDKVTIVERANAEVKRQKLTREGRPSSTYQSMLHVIPSYNIAERLFSC